MDGQPQHLKALAKGTQKRKDRANLKRLVEAGEVPVDTVILHPPAYLKTTSSSGHPVTVADVLSWQHGWKLKRAQAFLYRNRKHLVPLGIEPGTELIALSEGRRKLLARVVRSV